MKLNSIQSIVAVSHVRVSCLVFLMEIHIKCSWARTSSDVNTLVTTPNPYPFSHQAPPIPIPLFNGFDDNETLDCAFYCSGQLTARGIFRIVYAPAVRFELQTNQLHSVRVSRKCHFIKCRRYRDVTHLVV